MTDKSLVLALSAYQMGKPTKCLYDLAYAFVRKAVKNQILIDMHDIVFELVSDFLHFVKYHPHKSVKWLLSVYKRRKSYAITSAQLRMMGIGLDYDKYLRQGWNTSELARLHRLVVLSKTSKDVVSDYVAKYNLKARGRASITQEWYRLHTAISAHYAVSLDFEDGGARI